MIFSSGKCGTQRARKGTGKMASDGAKAVDGGHFKLFAGK